MITILLIILAIILILVGVLGLIHPALPGLPLMFAGAWTLAYIGDYQIIGITTLVILGIITLIGVALDFISGLLGAKYTGASKTALWGAFWGGVIGIFFALPGLIFGPLIGAAIGEFIERKSLLASGKVGMGTFIGFIIGVVAKVGCALAILLTIISMYAITGIRSLF